MSYLGQKIKELREAKGLLLRQVAACLEIDTAQMSKLERGERVAKREQISQLANLFEVEENLLLTIWLSDKVLKVLSGETLASQALKQAQTHIKHS